MTRYLLSPVVPQLTGTADYLSDLVNSAALEFCDRKFKIVTDFRNGRPHSSQINGVPIINYADFRPRNDDLIFVFLANNRYHDHCFDFLMKDGDFRIVSIFHDLQLFMEYSHLCGNRISGYDSHEMLQAMKFEHPNCSNVLFDQYQRKKLPEILKYSLLCNYRALQKSKKIVVHSHYAKNRLILETPKNIFPDIVVAEHPHLPRIESLESNFHRDDHFIIGCFGWISAFKRPKQIVRAFHTFLTSCETADRQFIKLKFVGKLSEKSQDPLVRATRYGIENNVEVKGYLAKDKFLKEMSHCALILNLRFPSCGETSGTLSNSHDNFKPTVVTRYQSFSEERASYFSSFTSCREHDDLVQAMKNEFQKWKQRSSADERPQERSLSQSSLKKIPLKKVILDIAQELTQ